MTSGLINIQMAMAPRLVAYNILIRLYGADLTIPNTSFIESVTRAAPVIRLPA